MKIVQKVPKRTLHKLARPPNNKLMLTELMSVSSSIKELLASSLL